jgi:SAM-dependent methyltransferase
VAEPSPCRVCAAATVHAGIKRGRTIQRDFELRHCEACGFSFVENFCDDYSLVYSERYYSGLGSDPLVDYISEMTDPRSTLRRLEWQGIVDLVSDLSSLSATTHWLDYGCGNGGLVRYCLERVGCQIVGFDQGWITTMHERWDVPTIAAGDFGRLAGTFDVVTAVEVIEHTPNPVDVLRALRELLRPGGILLLTTGNAEKVRGPLCHWSYVIPEIHVGFFEPRTLMRAYELAGFDRSITGYRRGHRNIIRYKILKNLGVRQTRAWEGLVPWGVVTRAADRRYGISAMPFAVSGDPVSA